MAAAHNPLRHINTTETLPISSTPLNLSSDPFAPKTLFLPYKDYPSRLPFGTLDAHAIKKEYRKINDPDMIAVLALIFKPGFMLGKLQGEDLQNYRSNLKKEGPPLTIHGVFFHGSAAIRRDLQYYFARGNGKFFSEVYKDLQVYFKLNPDKIKIVYMIWVCYYKAKKLPTNYWTIAQEDALWEQWKYEFRFLVEEFLKHGKPMLMEISEYADLGVKLYYKIVTDTTDPTVALKNRKLYNDGEWSSSGINHDGSYKRCRILDMVDALLAGGFKIPRLEFLSYSHRYRVMTKHNEDSFICSFCEMKCSFNSGRQPIHSHYPATYVCDCRRGFATDQLHKVSNLSKWERLRMKV